MTKISVSDGDEYRVMLEGHATGSEIVCAGLSAISLTLAGYLESIDVEVIKFEECDGFVEIIWRGGVEARCAYDMARCGYWLMSREYPEYCCIT